MLDSQGVPKEKETKRKRERRRRRKTGKGNQQSKQITISSFQIHFISTYDAMHVIINQYKNHNPKTI